MNLEQADRFTLLDVLDATVGRRPDVLALVCDERSLTWFELAKEIDGFSAMLMGVGVGPGDVVGFAINKRPEVVIGFLACARIGAVMAPVNFKLNTSQIVDQIRTAEITAWVTQRSREALNDVVIEEFIDRCRLIYVGGSGPEGTTDYNDHDGFSAVSKWPEINPQTVCYYNYTSGSTGRPKGAITTHQQILTNAVATIDALGFTQSDVFLGMFSVFAHPHELFHRSLVVGGTFVILDTLSPRRIAQAVEKFSVTWMMAVPSFYEMMLDHRVDDNPQRAENALDLSSLRVLESGGAFVSAGTLARMEEAFDACFLPVWGCTEATGVAIANGPGSHRRGGSTGTVVEGYRVRVVDDNGDDVEDGEVGEMMLSGNAVVGGYINADEQAQGVFVDGWYATGDLVCRDKCGVITFVSRKSEMLKIGGIRVYPLEIERVLLSHPEIEMAVVVRGEDRIRGEIARAIVVRHADSELSIRDVQRWTRHRLAVYKVPRVVEFWTEVPRLANGKIDKSAISQTPIQVSRDVR